jgi:acetyl esterase/lipase
VVWIHGGALIMGDRDGVPKDLMEFCRDANYVLISLDYRLAPETRLPEIAEDIQDAFRWIHAHAEELRVERRKIVVAGGSAGGYLTLLSGTLVEPRPKALLAYWGYGSIDAPWYTEPSAHYRQAPLVSKQEAESAVGGAVLTRPDARPRGKYYLYLRQNGLWTREIAGFDPQTERDKLTPFCPVRNVTPAFPPTMLVHGTADTDVPYEESAEMAKALAAQGVPHELVTVKDGGHGLGGGDPREVAAARAKALAFVRKQLD